MGSGGGDGDFRTARNINFRGRGGDGDGEGWSTVKPRKSFGQEGAERFTGRMGGDHRNADRGLKERDEHDGAKDRRRTFDLEGEEGDPPRRNGLTRGRTDPWFKENTPTSAKTADATERASNRERIEKAKSWRAQDPGDKTGNQRTDRGNDRYERRWDRERDQRPAERDPEWMDEPLEEEGAGHTEADLKSFMESMKRSRGGPKAEGKSGDAMEGPPGLPSFFTPEPPAVKSAPAVEKGPDRFFAAFGEAQLTADSPGGDKTEAAKAPATKSSRFANLFSAQTGEVRGQTEPSTPAAASAPAPPNGGPADAHFQNLLSKLQRPRATEQHSTPTPPNVNAYSQPPPPQAQKGPHDPIRELSQALAQKAQLGSPEPMGPYGMGRGEEPRLRSVPPAGPEILAPRPMPPPSQPPSARPEQMLQDLVNQRNNAQSQGSGRMEYGPDPNAAFLMQLMQNRLPQVDPRPIEQIMRHPQPQRQAAIPHFQEREPEFMRERVPAQQRQMRPPQPPAGFAEEQFRRSEDPGRMMQPTQILQRQAMPPPGLDQSMPGQQQLWAGQQGPPGGQRQGPMILPPGLQGNRPPPNGPMPPGMFNPGPMPPGMFSPADNMPGPQRVPPPPGFFPSNPIPGPGFMPGPPGMGGAFPGPEGMLFPGPFGDGRGMPPPGSAPFRR